MTDIQRDRWGRPLIVPPGGGKAVPYRRASGIGKALEDDTNLTYWRARVVAIGLMRRPDLQALVLGHQDHKDTELRNAVEEAFRAGGGEERRNQGTALHKLSELADFSTLPDSLRRDLDAYREALGRHGLTEIESETFVVHDDWKIAGTFDRLLDGFGQWFVADIKTGASVQYGQGSWACQLAVYANGLRYDASTGERSPLVQPSELLDTDTGLIIHLPAGEGRCEIHEIDLRPAAKAIETALWVHEWRNTSKRLLTPLTIASPAADAVPQPQVTTATAPAQDVQAAGDADMVLRNTPLVALSGLDRSYLGGYTAHILTRFNQLLEQGIDQSLIAARWPAGVVGPKKASEWTSADLAGIKAALDAVERAHGTEFTEAPTDPRRLPDPHRSAALRPDREPTVDIEGPDVSPAEREALVNDVAGLVDDQRDAFHAIVAACGEVGATISLRTRPSERRYRIAASLLALGRRGELGDDDRLRALCAHATGDEACLMPGVPLGEVVGRLSLDEASALLRLCSVGDVSFVVGEDAVIRVAVAA